MKNKQTTKKEGKRNTLTLIHTHTHTHIQTKHTQSSGHLVSSFAKVIEKNILPSSVCFFILVFTSEKEWFRVWKLKKNKTEHKTSFTPSLSLSPHTSCECLGQHLNNFFVETFQAFSGNLSCNFSSFSSLSFFPLSHAFLFHFTTLLTFLTRSYSFVFLFFSFHISIIVEFSLNSSHLFRISHRPILFFFLFVFSFFPPSIFSTSQYLQILTSFSSLFFCIISNFSNLCKSFTFIHLFSLLSFCYSSSNFLLSLILYLCNFSLHFSGCFSFSLPFFPRPSHLHMFSVFVVLRQRVHPWHSPETTLSLESFFPFYYSRVRRSRRHNSHHLTGAV